MSNNNTHGRHRATTGSRLSTISRSVSTHRGRVGRQAVLVAVGSGLVLSMAAPAQAGATASDPQSGTAPGAVSSSAVIPGQAAARGASVHTVNAGETLSRIGALNGVSLDAILSLNGLQMSSIIYPGDVITLSGAAGTPGVESAAVPAPIAPAASAGETYQPSAVVPASSDGGQKAPSPINQTVLNSALAQTGATQDCTVLGEVALRAAGIQGVGDESPESLMAYATPVSTPEPGDFIYYADGGMGFSHNAIYLGNGQAMHSGWNGNQTVIFDVNVGSGPAYYRVNA
ncbi:MULTISPECIES: C40 family peptidase [unclassified Arthrobacter]|uniref:C40 family peptidase n=1 Tax=unclassified Arthrobacter TaxID=235627 RepID=UPI002E0C52F4|nr:MULTISPECIES: LysM peptidoglycan-binding domain-containing protein [unclassified Arthrobacter]MEC5193355.1 cell wall-associated NlpC family hydrolase [Arthrobacter sp. MP_M4]MEC5204821.1 cell wall-associated NlpC family hydrolase [Arthrobacter sp. MP_M7]